MMNCLVTVNDQEKETGHQIKQNSKIQQIESVDDLKQKYPDRFKGLGKLSGKHKLIMDKDVQPVIHAPRRAPIQLRDKIKTELDRMQAMGVIRPVEELTDWVSSIT